MAERLLVPKTKDLERPQMIKAIAPEIIAGMHDFLELNGRSVPEIPVGHGGGIARKIGLRYRAKEIHAVPVRVVSALQDVKAILPESGRAFKEEVTELARKVVIGRPKEMIRSLLHMPARDGAPAYARRRDVRMEEARYHYEHKAKEDSGDEYDDD